MKLVETVLKGKFDISFDPEINYDQEKKYLTQKFINFCIDELKIEGTFKAKLVGNREKYAIKTTAYYLDSNKILIIYAKGRMLGDVMRSIAHELTHKRQYEQNRIKHPVQDVGGEIEDEANAMAGVIIKKFIKYDEDGSKVFY